MDILDGAGGRPRVSLGTCSIIDQLSFGVEGAVVRDVFYPDGKYLILDEDEIAECHEDGRLTGEDLTYIDSAQQSALANFKPIPRLYKHLPMC